MRVALTLPRLGQVEQAVALAKEMRDKLHETGSGRSLVACQILTDLDRFNTATWCNLACVAKLSVKLTT